MKKLLAFSVITVMILGFASAQPVPPNGLSFEVASSSDQVCTENSQRQESIPMNSGNVYVEFIQNNATTYLFAYDTPGNVGESGPPRGDTLTFNPETREMGGRDVEDGGYFPYWIHTDQLAEGETVQTGIKYMEDLEGGTLTVESTSDELNISKVDRISKGRDNMIEVVRLGKDIEEEDDPTTGSADYYYHKKTGLFLYSEANTHTEKFSTDTYYSCNTTRTQAITGSSTDEDQLEDWFEYAISDTNWKNNDTDGDGLNDSIEWRRGLNPNAKDTDGDGTIDQLNVNRERENDETQTEPAESAEPEKARKENSNGIVGIILNLLFG